MSSLSRGRTQKLSHPCRADGATQEVTLFGPWEFLVVQARLAQLFGREPIGRLVLHARCAKGRLTRHATTDAVRVHVVRATEMPLALPALFRHANRVRQMLFACCTPGTRFGEQCAILLGQLFVLGVKAQLGALCRRSVCCCCCVFGFAFGTHRRRCCCHHVRKASDHCEHWLFHWSRIQSRRHCLVPNNNLPIRSRCTRSDNTETSQTYSATRSATRCVP